MSIPQTRTWEEPSSFLSTGLRPFYMTGHLVQLLRQHFADPENIEHPELRDNVWKPDLATNRILIEPARKLNTSDLERRPALLVRRGAFKNQIDGIGDGLLQNHDGLDDVEHYQQRMLGTHQIQIIGTTYGEVEILAQETFSFLREFGSKIRCDAGLLRFRVEGVSEVAPVKEYDNHEGVVITLEYGWMDAWMIVPEASPLKTVSLETVPA